MHNLTESTPAIKQWAFAWNAPLQAIESPLPTYEELHRRDRENAALACAQDLLQKQSVIVRMSVNATANKLEQEQGAKRANAFLAKTFLERIWPRVKIVSERYNVPKMTVDTSRFMYRFNHLPDMSREDIDLLAQDLATFITLELSSINDEMPDAGELKLLHALYVRAAAITQAFRQPAPDYEKLTRRYFDEPHAVAALSRMMSEQWWAGRLRRHSSEWREHLHIALNHVSKKASTYASKQLIRDWKEQKRRTREFLKSMELMDEEGNRISLIDKYWGSVANPAIRRTEMMVRIRGFENVCNELGYVGEFYTITAPSKYHATTIHGHRNRKWDGSSPADTQGYLRKVWGRIRAKLHRNDLRVFGIRVAEPHHDGTPHWHMLLFMRPEEVEQVRGILRDYAMDEDHAELITAKARKARFHAESIDPEKGSATGYVAKYISKNIDGYALDEELDDESGKPMKEAAAAAAAWASCWRIRQFQFVGGAPVTVWRELRRMADHDTAMGLSVEFAAVHDAADNGDWAKYINEQGGPFVRRDELIARTWYETGQEFNAYGEEVVRVKGVFSPVVGVGSPILTRLTKWKIVPKLTADQAVAVSGANAPPRSSVNNCTEGGTRRRLKLELRSRGFDGSDEEIDILKRGGGLRFGQSALIYRNGRLQEKQNEPMQELWPGWL
ncbi:replication endonuclease [Salmonella enterica]|uniref:Replication endonuclease n=1 Tax=Salmonella houtenae TaxID=59205 RepID=A0A5Y6M5P3_SALHO|nr:replication endonuclease [Salmonella enterica]EBF8287872.1 replication endonuclease [Salmonella enterica subsp. houtenae]EBG8260688.1 replication endonuclease [Salmonella enterica subsp. enterica serovar Java]EBQ5981999.1 replication endonuclease [Salmonella enterica subsp. houtenae serovar Houten]ECB6697242.1 replication endonuclease [Salmonella enterica subsp. enterica serovar Stanley]ECC3218312.1 replication endonuclease [Salmonella enterica subsp. enterica]ECH7006800.1 replication endo